MTRLLIATCALAGIAATVLLTIALAIIHGIPVLNIASVLLLPLGAASGLLRPRSAPTQGGPQ